MVNEIDAFGKTSIALAILGAVIPLVLMYLIPSSRDNLWLEGVYIIILIELLAFVFGILGWRSKYAKIGFAVSILVASACVAYLLPSFDGKKVQINSISQ